MSKATARFRRRIIVGVMALGTLVWVTADQYGVPRENLGWMFVYTLVAIACIIAASAVAVGLLIVLRKLMGR